MESAGAWVAVYPVYQQRKGRVRSLGLKLELNLSARSHLGHDDDSQRVSCSILECLESVHDPREDTGHGAVVGGVGGPISVWLTTSPNLT